MVKYPEMRITKEQYIDTINKYITIRMIDNSNWSYDESGELVFKSQTDFPLLIINTGFELSTVQEINLYNYIVKNNKYFCPYYYELLEVVNKDNGNDIEFTGNDIEFTSEEEYHTDDSEELNLSDINNPLVKVYLNNADESDYCVIYTCGITKLSTSIVNSFNLLTLDKSNDRLFSANDIMELDKDKVLEALKVKNHEVKKFLDSLYRIAEMVNAIEDTTHKRKKTNRKNKKKN